MNYFKYTEDNVLKYRVLFDREEIEKLRIEVINKCSRIVHKEFEGYMFLGKVDNLRIRNFRRIRIGVHEFIDGPDEDIYHFSYDEYVFPLLVKLIDKLLDGNVSVIDKIFDDIISEHITYDLQIKEKSNELDKIDNLDFDKKQKKLDELKQLVESAKLNQRQEPVREYYNKLQNLITLEYVESITTLEVSRVNDFFSDKYEKQKVRTKSIGG